MSKGAAAHLARVHDEHAIVIADGVEPVRNAQQRGAREFRLDRLLQLGVRLHVDTAGSLVLNVCQNCVREPR